MRRDRLLFSLNCELVDETLCSTMRKLFDDLVKGLSVPSIGASKFEPADPYIPERVVAAPELQMPMPAILLVAHRPCIDCPIC
jgi:hypothetical protein